MTFKPSRVLFSTFTALAVTCTSVEATGQQKFVQKSSTASTLASFAATTPTPSNKNNNNNNNSNSNSNTKKTPKSIDPKYWPQRFPAKDHCSKCGLCETSFVQYVASSCAFLNEGMARIDHMEERIHGRRRHRMDSNSNSDSNSDSDTSDEVRFGVLHEPILLAKGVQSAGKDIDIENDEADDSQPQWTGVVTNIAISMLEQNLVDAVVCIASSDSKILSTSTSTSTTSFAEPTPIIAKTVKELKLGRGVKPSLAPSLNILDEIQNDTSIRKLLFCGVGCSVQAFRSVEDKLDLDDVYVLGTNCADNSPSANAANNFLQKAMDIENIQDVQGYEFMQDYKVHVKMKPDKDDAPIYKKKPYFCLPSEVAKDAIADSCLACFDYTNALADVVVGYMGAPLNDGGNMDASFQTLTCRNEKGKQMIEAALQMNKIVVSDEKEAKAKSTSGLISFENFALTTVKSDGLVQAMVNGGETEQEEDSATMPRVIGEVLAALLSRVGPKGLYFASYSIDYHVLRNYLHVLDEFGPKRAEQSLPQYAKDIVRHYTDNYDEFKQLKSAILTNNNIKSV